MGQRLGPGWGNSHWRLGPGWGNSHWRLDPSAGETRSGGWVSAGATRSGGWVPAGETRKRRLGAGRDDPVPLPLGPSWGDSTPLGPGWGDSTPLGPGRGVPSRLPWMSRPDASTSLLDSRGQAYRRSLSQNTALGTARKDRGPPGNGRVRCPAVSGLLVCSESSVFFYF